MAANGRTSFTSWILLCLLCFSLWWALRGSLCSVSSGLCLLYCFGGYYWAHCVFPVPFGLCGIHLPWLRIRNFQCILIGGKNLSVLCLQTTNLVQVCAPVIFAWFLPNFVFSPVSCLKENKRQAFLSFCWALVFIPVVLCAELTHQSAVPVCYVIVCPVLSHQIRFLQTHEFTFRPSCGQCPEHCLCIQLTKLKLSTCCSHWLLWPMSVRIQGVSFLHGIRSKIKEEQI